ncbi:MAG: ZIP family metal transporter [Calditrichaeota bacterium]|nr:ZIP family metal transporter [Calditrichota bacterium]
MNDHLTLILIYSGSIIIVAWIGGLIPLYFRQNSKILHWFISFGAGILLGAAFLHMLPDAAEYIGSDLGLPALAGFLMLFILEKFIMTHPCPSEHCEYHQVGLSAFIGLSLHSLITGLALGAGVLVPRLGFIVFLAVILHKLPASLSLTSLFLKENYSNKKIFAHLTVFSLMVPIGAIITFFFLKNTDHKTIGFLIAFSAGTFLHVAADDLLPEVHQHSHERISRLISFIIGLIIIWIITFIE